LVSKVIANRIKPVLSRELTCNQLGFLKGRQILDAIGTTQECIHSIKARKQKSLILKLDLRKAYDCVNWDFLRLILVQTGFSLQSIQWIMSCVVSSSFAVLINGEATSFFTSERGLRQGCPLSPLLFILVMECISLLLKKGQVEGLLSGVKVSRIIKILHLIFVDDVLIMSKAVVEEWQVIKSILESFCCASGLRISPQKSTFHYNGIHEDSLAVYRRLFDYNFVDLVCGISVSGISFKTW
jgi:hypothetical protein